jgi:hypothetical protein
VIYEHEEPWWNDIDRVKLLIRPPELSGKSTRSHPIANQEELGEEMMTLAFDISLFILGSDIYMP